ncbi:MAG: DUF547 domain-containing protein, partial [Candidatus Hydrogenedentota bacterium]
MKATVLFFSGFLFVTGTLYSAWLDPYKPSKILQVKKVDNHLWKKWLRKYVTKTGWVKYSAGKKDISLVKAYTKQLRSINVNGLKNRNEKLAFYINLYNSMTVLGVYQYAHINSVMSRKGFFKANFYLVKKKISLDVLENKIIRPKFREPLVHFALNCASYSCPPLRNEPYEGYKLYRQLKEQAKKYMSNPKFVKIDDKEKTLYLIELFKWYK